MEISIRDMKNRLSKYLKLVRMGKEVVITDRGRPVARLMAVKPVAEETEAEVIERIEALAWVRPGKRGKIKGAKHPIPWKPGDKLVSDIVLEDRD
jgi:prevent-host-death family protein